jgi:hypothetical protein
MPENQGEHFPADPSAEEDARSNRIRIVGNPPLGLLLVLVNDLEES